MQVRYQQSSEAVRNMNTAQLRDHFLIQDLMKKNKISWVYTHYDRVMVGGAKPVSQKLILQSHEELKASYFLERRELGIINVGAKGVVTVDGKKFMMESLDCLYIGRGAKKVVLESSSSKQPAIYYMISAPAHHTYPTKLAKLAQAQPTPMGDAENSNERIIYKYIHENGIKSCQLVMGLTLLKAGSVWNSFPPHTHDRRTEIYFYFDMPANNQVYHFMGLPQETRHLVVGNQEAVISPSWSMHYGCGTSHYSFIWAMAGENQDFADMDQVGGANIH
jgi:4-deoxy-L-threo-5-hexosulose-uronate ketol-isomerase